MKVLVLGGCGLQGKAVLHDLSKSPQVKEVVCADVYTEGIKTMEKHLDMNKIKVVKFDIKDRAGLVAMMKDGVDIVIDVLPAGFLEEVGEAALEAEVSVVNTMYGYMFPESFNKRAAEKNITFMPEAGFDPGIDLALCAYGVSKLDEVHDLHSIAGGIPEATAIDNPLKYKISWTWHGVLLSYKRKGKIMVDGKIIDIPAKEQFAKEGVKHMDFPGLGTLEVIPNGNAMEFCEYLNIMDTIKNTTRCTFRWPGHSEFWKIMNDMNFLSDEPVEGVPCELTPHEFMLKHLAPQLQYKEDERDMAVMRTIVGGIKDGKKMTLTYDMLDYRDLETGLMAMNRTVGYTASIVAQMIVNGEITKKGVLTAIKDIPFEKLLDELKKRGIIITEKIEIYN